MKCVIAFSCLLAVASAGLLRSPILLGEYDDGSYKGEIYNSAISLARFGTPLVAGPQLFRVAAPIAHAGLVSEARLIDPVAIAAGAPLPTGDTVEVAAAKAAHAQAHAVAKGLAIGAPIVHGLTGITHGAPFGLVSEARLVDPVAIAAGAPLPGGDTVEVAAAKAFHANAHAAATTGHLLNKGYLGLGGLIL